MELMFSVPLPEATAGGSFGAGVGFGVGGVGAAVVVGCLPGAVGGSGVFFSSGGGSAALLEAFMTISKVRSAWPSWNSMFCLKSAKPFLLATMLYGFSEVMSTR